MAGSTPHPTTFLHPWEQLGTALRRKTQSRTNVWCFLPSELIPALIQQQVNVFIELLTATPMPRAQFLGERWLSACQCLYVTQINFSTRASVYIYYLS